MTIQIQIDPIHNLASEDDEERRRVVRSALIAALGEIESRAPSYSIWRLSRIGAQGGIPFATLCIEK